MKTLGIILSGGRGTRVNGADKGLLAWGNTTRVESVISALRPQVDELLISCNRNLERYGKLGVPLVQDQLSGYQGPLAGIAAALNHTDCDIAVIVPCDCPTPSADLATRLIAALKPANVQLSYAHDGIRPQYLFAAIRAQYRDSLCAYLESGQRSVKGWYQMLNSVVVDFSDRTENFSNINTP